MLDQTYPLEKKLALGIHGTAATLLKVQFDTDTVEAYAPLPTLDRESLYVSVTQLAFQPTAV